MPSTVAIIMRAKDEMPYVEETLRMLKQQTFSDFDLFAVDSGSTDGSLQALEKYGCALHRIKPEAYIPGPVLNDAVRRTEHKLIVLLNADAVPCSNRWLESLIRPVMEGEADAVFSRQEARADAHFIVKYDYDRAYRAENTGPDFFSAVACAFRRKIWESRPFPETGYAEDARWATDQVRMGNRFQLQEDSVVIHSHNYTLKELYRKRYRQACVLETLPKPGRLLLRALREIGRDSVHAVKHMKLQTIPYNLMYRITIYRAVLRGLKEQSSK